MIGLSIPVAATILVTAGYTGAGYAGADPAAAVADDPQYLTWTVDAPRGSEVFSTVYDTDTQGSVIVSRNHRNGKVKQTFGSGGVASGVAATKRGSVAVARQQGTVDAYEKRGRLGYRHVGTYPVAVPGQSETPFLGGIALGQDGTWLTVASVGDAINVPQWVGAVAVDSDGATTGTWTVPADSDLPPNAFILASAISSTDDGSIFVRGIPCQAGLCGSPVIEKGWLYELRLGKDGSLTQVNEWTSPGLADGQHLAMIDDTSFFAVGATRVLGTLPDGLQLATPESGASVNDVFQFSIEGDRIETTGRLTGSNAPTYVAVETRGAVVTAFVVELGSGESGTYTIERFQQEHGKWVVRGGAWPAQWGSEGPS